MYKTPIMHKTLIKGEKPVEGESIEKKVRRLIENKEPIKDGSPLLYTERSKGVDPAHNIRTDRWEIATDAMDKVHKSKLAKRDDKGVKEDAKKGDKEDAKIIEMKDGKKNDGTTESTPGKVESK